MLRLFLPFYVGFEEVLVGVLQVVGFSVFLWSTSFFAQVDVCKGGLVSLCSLALVRLVFRNGGLTT